MKYYRFRRRKVEGENTFQCSLWTWLEAMELKCNIFTPILFSVTMKYSKFLLFYEEVIWTSIWGKKNQRGIKKVISLNWDLYLNTVWAFHSSSVWLFFPFFFSLALYWDCFCIQNRLQKEIISCFLFSFRILKVLTQVKNTFVTLHGVMSLLGSLWAKGRYVCLC